MSRSRILLTLALAATLATPCAYGTPREERMRPAGLVEQAWGFVTAIWSELGFGIDPHGTDSSGQGEDPAVPETDIGCNIDPHGGCTPGN